LETSPAAAERRAYYHYAVGCAIVALVVTINVFFGGIEGLSG